MSRFRKFLGKIEMDIDGEKFEVKPSVEDRIEMAECYEKPVKERYTGLRNVLIKILVRTKQEDESEQEVTEFVDRKFETLLKELAIAYGWTTRAEMEKAMKEITKKVTPEGT